MLAFSIHRPLLRTGVHTNTIKKITFNLTLLEGYFSWVTYMFWTRACMH